MEKTDIHKKAASLPQTQLKQAPFFAKEGQDSFFSKGAESQPSFFNPPTVQPKLKVGEPNDKYEVEADAMADKVVQKITAGADQTNNSNGGSHTVQRKCAQCGKEEEIQKKEVEEIQRKPIFESNEMPPEAEIQRKCASCAEEEEVQRKAAGSENKTTGIENQLSASKGKGTALTPELQNEMGTAFGNNFSEVRVHTGSTAVQMNKDLNAQAFTHGNDIYFNQGKYEPTSTKGKHLLAHELTHTVQQSGQNSKAIPNVQCFRDHLSTIVGPLGSENEEGQRIELYPMGDGPIRVGTSGVYSLGFTPPQRPENLSFHWMVLDNATERPIHTRITNEPYIRINAEEPGSYLVYVSIKQNGRVMQTNTGGSAFLQINQRVGSESSDQNLESQILNSTHQGIAGHNVPTCNGNAIPLNQSFTYRLGEIPRPADNCSFTPLFEIPEGARSLSVRAHAVNPPAGDWRMTLFECPFGLSNRIACDRNFGQANSMSGSISQDLVFEYDPLAWNTRRVFIRIRNGAESLIPNVLLTLTPNFRDSVIQTIHDALSILGLIPGLGIVPDAIDTSIYLIEGDWGGAILSAAAMAPAFGEAATVVRLGSRDVIRVHASEVSTLGIPTIRTRLSRIRDRAAMEPSAPRRQQPDLDVDVDETVDAIVEEARSTSRPARRGRLRRSSNNSASRSARTAFNRVRDGFAERLGVPSGGQVHHAIELQALDRYPGVFSPDELNDFENMRGIGVELARRRQLHNSSIRYHWNRHYRALDREITRRGLEPSTEAYNEYVRSYMESARDEIDFIMGQFFTEYRTGRERIYEQ